MPNGQSPDDFLKPQAQPANATMPDMISSAASMAGVPLNIATALVKQESSFNPKAKSPVGAMGLTQLMPGTAKEMGVSDPFNPAENLAGGFKYLAQMKDQFGSWSHALAAYNWGPGNVADWIKNGADPSKLPGETRAYVHAIAPDEAVALEQSVAKKKSRLELLGRRGDGEHPQDFLKSSSAGEHPSDFLAKPAPTASPSADLATRTAQSTNPMDTPGDPNQTGSIPVGGHTVLQQAGGALMPLGPAIMGMEESSVVKGHGWFGPEFQGALGAYIHNPAQAQDQYGWNAKPVGDFVMAHADPNSMGYKTAKWDQEHPGLAGLLTFGESMLEPGNKLAGKGLEPVVNPLFEKLTDLLSPFRGIANAVGHKGASAVRAIASRMQAPVGDVEEEIEKIFGGLTPQEKQDVLRRSEPLGQRTAKVTDSQHDLQARAQQYRALVKRVTAEQKGAHPELLADNRTFNTDLYHPMSGQFRDPQYDDAMNDVLENLRGLQGSGGGMSVRKGTAALNGPHKALKSIDEVLSSGLLKDDYDPAAATRQWATRRLQNVAFENSINDLPSTLRRPIMASDYQNGLGTRLSTPFARSAGERPQVTLARTLSENNARYAPGHPERFELRPVDGLVPANEALRSIGSPTLNESLIHPELAKFFQKQGGSVLSGKPAHEWDITLPGGKVIKAGALIDHYNGAMRSAIIANPLFHPIWNLRENMAAAGRMPIAAIRQTLKTVVGAVSKKGYDWMDSADSKLFHQASQKSDEYAQAVQEAIKDGSTAEFHPTKSVLGNDIATVRTAPMKGATAGMKFDKMMTSVRDWNTRSTFGPTGEQAYAVSLYKRLKTMYPHLSGPEIGNMVRDSLGAYQNVDPGSPMSRLFFFYPWLKGNTLIWMKNMLTRPEYVTAPLEGIRRNNQLAGDPNFGGAYPTKDYTIYRGQQNNQPSYETPPLPQRVAAGVVNAAGTGDLGEMGYEGENIIRGHANPMVGNVLDLFTTMAKDPASPKLPSNYNVVFDKHAPIGEQWKQLRNYLVGHDVPVPLVQFAVQDALRRGVSPQGLADEMHSAAGIGYPSERLSRAQSMYASRARKEYERVYQQAKQSGNGALAAQAYANYMQQLRNMGVIH